MKKVLRKFSLGNVSDVLSDSMKKRIFGGYGTSGCCISYKTLTGPGECVDDCDNDKGRYGCGCNTADAKATCHC